ncbi:MAG: hypothetical protein C4337_09210 [Armatimonadota bacterium]
MLDQGDCRIYRVAGTGYVGFCQRGGVPDPSERVVLTLVSSQVDAWDHHLQAYGVPVVKPPTYKDRIHHLFARDPNGYLNRFSGSMTLAGDPLQVHFRCNGYWRAEGDKA